MKESKRGKEMGAKPAMKKDGKTMGAKPALRNPPQASKGEDRYKTDGTPKSKGY